MLAQVRAIVAAGGTPAQSTFVAAADGDDTAHATLVRLGLTASSQA